MTCGSNVSLKPPKIQPWHRGLYTTHRSVNLYLPIVVYTCLRRELGRERVRCFYNQLAHQSK